MISTIDTHETVKSLTAAGFTDAQAEALTAAVKKAVDIDFSNIATKTGIADVRREIAEVKAELVKWVVGVGFARPPPLSDGESHETAFRLTSPRSIACSGASPLAWTVTIDGSALSPMRRPTRTSIARRPSGSRSKSSTQFTTTLPSNRI
jgi:hypothetical protein